MEGPELRIGGWVQQKKRGKKKKLFSILLNIKVIIKIGSPTLSS